MNRRHTLVIVSLFTVSFVLIVGTYFRSSRSLSEGLRAKLESFQAQSWKRPGTSQEQDDIVCDDPFVLPGYLWVPPDRERYRETKWVPLSRAVYEADDPPAAAFPPPDGKDVAFGFEGERVMEEEEANIIRTWTVEGSISWMTEAVEEARRRTTNSIPYEDSAEAMNKDLSWLWGRRVLLIGDSVDRFEMQYFCAEFNSTITVPAQHTTATCNIPVLNLTVVHWHFPGTYTSRPSWWWMPDMAHVPFEERWEKLWRPTLGQLRGPSGNGPDLVLYQSGLWDQRMFWESGAAQARSPPASPESEAKENSKRRAVDVDLGNHDRHLTPREIAFFLARTKKFVSTLLSEFPTSHIMYRSLTPHRDSGGQDASLAELEVVGRMVAQKNTIDVFEWAKLVGANKQFYSDPTHLGHGGSSWLWGEMVLAYLHQAVEKGSGAAWKCTR